MKVLVISGGMLDLAWAREWLSGNSFDFVIAADSGLEYADALGIPVDFLLGDYDSVNQEMLEKYRKNTKMVTYPSEKDYTDTHLALMKAVESGADWIAVIGATGSRYDHAMTNIYNMKLALEHKIFCAMYDAHNKIYLADHDYRIDKNSQYGKYLSFVPMTETVEITLTGVKYPLNRYLVHQGLSICQSNEIVEEQAEIQIANGIVIALETKD